MHIFEKRGTFDLFACAGVVGDGEATKTALDMRDLYIECSRQLLSENDVAFHALMMPAMAGGHYIYAVGGADDLGIDAADLLGEDVVDGDCVVVMGSELLERDRTEGEMLEVVLADVALHVSRLWTVADPTFGDKAVNVGWAATAATLASAHDVIRLEGTRETFIDKIKDAATAGVVHSRTVARRSGAVADSRRVIDTIENVCNRALETRGGFLPLPATALDIADCAKMALLDVVDRRKAA